MHKHSHKLVIVAMDWDGYRDCPLIKMSEFKYPWQKKSALLRPVRERQKFWYFISTRENYTSLVRLFQNPTGRT